MKKLYKVGIYCRLSVDDASNSAKAKNYIPADESVSIENQYELLSKFVMLNGWTEVKSYRDDGYSGGDFQRPGFLEMLEDARHGLINLRQQAIGPGRPYATGHAKIQKCCKQPVRYTR